MTDKYILRQSMKGILPNEIIKKKKQRFMVPTDTWFNQEFGEYSKNLFDANKELVDKYFKKNYLEKLNNSNKLLSGKLLNFNKLSKLYYSRQSWTITNFVLWHNIFIDGEVPK